VAVPELVRKARRRFRRQQIASPGMPSRHLQRPWTVESVPNGYRVIDTNGIVLAHVYGQREGGVPASDKPLTNDEAHASPR
jgi:hypothetical protein